MHPFVNTVAGVCLALAAATDAAAQAPRALTAMEAVWLSQNTGRPILAVIGTCT